MAGAILNVSRCMNQTMKIISVVEDIPFRSYKPTPRQKLREEKSLGIAYELLLYAYEILCTIEFA
jgi:hypothetical protein